MDKVSQAQASIISSSFSLNIFFLVLQKVRDQIFARGAKTIRGLGRTFRTFDSFDGNNKVDQNEFLVGLKENGVQITKDEANLLLDFIDSNKDGTISFDEFLIAMRVSFGEIDRV